MKIGLEMKESFRELPGDRDGYYYEMLAHLLCQRKMVVHRNMAYPKWRALRDQAQPYWFH